MKIQLAATAARQHVAHMNDAFVISLSVLLMLAPQDVEANREPIRLKANGPWNMHYELEYCRLARSFGEGDNNIIMIFERHGSGDQFRLLLSGKTMRKQSDPAFAWIAFGADREAERFEYVSADLNAQPAWIISNGRLVPLPKAFVEMQEKHKWDEEPLEAPLVTPAEEAAIKEVRLERPLSKPVVLETGSLGRAFEALRACTDQLIENWGLDLEQQSTAIRLPRPVNNPGKWVTDSDYPDDMARQRQPALVNFRLIIDPTGAVETCHIQLSTHAKSFNAVVCDLVSKRAKFAPALDKDGQPIRSYYRNTVYFKI